MSAAAEVMTAGWQAHLALGFRHDGRRTILSRREHRGPLLIQRAFYPEGEPCHIYLLHPPGGVVGGDQLRLEVEVNDGAHALITTPAASKFYRSKAATAVLEQTFKVSSGATLEWLPQETILFADSHVRMQTDIRLEAGAGFIGWELLCLGRPASGEKYALGNCQQRFALWRDDEPLLIETTRLHGAASVLERKWGLQGANVMGTCMAVNADKTVLQAVRAADIQIANGLFTVTLIHDVLICRALALQAEPARQAFVQAWQIIRPLLLKRPASAPRIWFT
ncbi:MAG: urease accessory protein UreD [Gammaproteobacteria bacterium]